MKKYDQREPLSGQDLGKLYPKALSYDEKLKLDQLATKRRTLAQPSFPALRVAGAMSGVMAFWILSIRLGSLSFNINPIVGVSLSLLLFLASIGVLVLTYEYTSRLFDYQSRSIVTFLVIYAVLFFIAWGVAGLLVQADFIKLAFAPLSVILLSLAGNTLVTYIVAGLFVSYRH